MFLPNVFIYTGPATILEFLKNLFHFSPELWLVKYLCHSFIYARNIQQQLVILGTLHSNIKI